MSVGSKIIAVRKSQGVSRKELAERLGIPYTTLRNYETDYREPNIAMLGKIAESLGLPSPAYFVFDPVPEDAKSPAPMNGSGTEINPRYFELSEENRAVVDAVIDQLSKAGQSDG